MLVMRASVGALVLLGGDQRPELGLRIQARTESRRFGRFDPAHRTDIDVYSVPQLIVPSQIGQDMPGRHRRNARDPKRHVS